MSDTLAGQKVRDTYGRLLQIANANAGADDTLRTVRDGQGDATALSLSTTHGDLLVQPANTTTARGVRARFGETINVKDYGAAGDGIADDTAAFQAAAAMASSGGTIWIPPGSYLITAATLLRSNTIVAGAGWSSRIIVAENFVNPGDDDAGTYAIFCNENHGAASITDENIIIRDLYFDDNLNPAHAAFHHLKFRMARRVRVLDCRFLYGGDATACRGCDDVVIRGNHAVNCKNCAYDHWEGCNDVLVEGNYASADNDAVQFINFNPETEPPYATGTVSRRFRMIGNTLDGTGSSIVVPCQIEPLTNNSTYIEDATISGNTFKQARLTCRGDVRGLTIVGNTFRGMGFAPEVISVYPLNGGTPTGVSISGNVIADAATTGGNGGVIRCQVNDASVIGNWIGGTAYTGQAIYTDTARPNVLGNRVDAAVTGSTSGLPKFLQSGFRVLNSSDNYIGWEDASGGTGLRIYVQADNTLVVQSTNASGAARSLLSMATRSDTSNITWQTRHVFTDIIRLAPQTGITAAGATPGTATALTSNFCEVTTVAAGTGVRLLQPGAQSITGTRVVVWNAGANTLNVYPMSGGQINALGVDVADTIAAGSSKTYVALSATLYRIEG